MSKSFERIIYAGDRDISVWVLKFIIDQGIKPLVLMVSDKKRETHAQELITLCSHLDKSCILEGTQFKTKQGIKFLADMKPDYILGVHFPYVLPNKILEIPKYGVINLHPAYLPYNRGWHTPTWAIWEESPYGATLHFVDEEIDSGDIIYQKQIDVLPNDTADTLYKRVKHLEFEVFKEAWPSLLTGSYARKSISKKEGTIHKKADISSIQFIDMNKWVKIRDLIRYLRALTTNNIEEAAYFKINGKVYRMQLHIVEDSD